MKSSQIKALLREDSEGVSEELSQYQFHSCKQHLPNEECTPVSSYKFGCEVNIKLIKKRNLKQGVHAH